MKVLLYNMNKKRTKSTTVEVVFNRDTVSFVDEFVEGINEARKKDVNASIYMEMYDDAGCNVLNKIIA